MRIAVLFCCLALVAGTLTAQQYVYVPDNAPAGGSTNVIPFQGAFMKTDCRYQALYSAALLGSSPYKITDMAFAPAWTGDLKTTQFQVRISHFTGGALSSLMDSNIPNPVTVYDAPLKWAVTSLQWSPLGLTGTFDWNGTDNVVVDIRYQGGANSGSGSLGGCKYTKGAIPRAYAYGDYNAKFCSGQDTSAGLKTRFTVALAPTGPQDGDIIVGNFRDPNVVNSYGPGSILAINQGTGAVLTIAPSFTTIGSIVMGPNWIEMASDNKNFMVACIPAGATPTAIGNGIYFHSVDAATGAPLNTLIADTTASVGYCNCFDLDGDGTWILGGGTRVFSFDENTLTYQTLFTSSAGTVNGLTLDPALPKGNIVVGNFGTGTTTAKFLQADRSGLLATISTAGPAYLSGARVDFQTGDYMASAFGASANGTGGEFSRTTKAGVYTPLNDNVTSMYRANGLYLTKDQTAWILTYDWQTTPIPTIVGQYVCSVYKVDYQGVFITQYIYSSTLIRDTFAAAGITEYGSRHVVCNGSGKPGSTVKVLFSSRKASDAGMAYQMAAAFSYTNGIKFANGEVLDLTFDVLFFLSANNLAPGIFQNFGGFLDKNGNAAAAINIPAGLPSGTGIPIFVSGIVIDPKAPGGVTTVGNTHWFTLN